MSDDEINALVGNSIKMARESRGLTQEMLGERIGVQRARICSIEKGVNLRLSTLRKIYRALDYDAKLTILGIGSFPLD